MVDRNTAKAIFLAAIEMPPAERAGFLLEATASDTALRKRVESLLGAHDNHDDFLEQPAAHFGAVVGLSPTEPSIVERPGTVIGLYKLLEQIGDGGMGVVYMADQEVPIRRRVALKIIKPGMDTRQVIARFEAERQALALMDHPNIVRVLDAGTTDSGRPYFVMELIRGVPVTEYCDEKNLTVQERLELFNLVCHAVQHAHQKGIIHRDLKPSNVLVTQQDGRPAPKVIDFGVAKAINQQLTDKTLFTNFAQMVGTPLYMSPEQVGTTSQDIDTRSDIYSLGVMLYELLTGTTPFDRQRMGEAAYEETRRIIREEEPPRPSTRIGTLGDRRSETAAHRLVDEKRLHQLVRGDLDWIVMKALDKDRNRRYGTADALARDLKRYMSDQAVEACPPSAIYRFGKFARRNSVALTMALVVSALLIAGTMVSTWQALRARRAERVAEAARTAEAQQRAQSDSNFQNARKTVDEYFTLVSESKLLDIPGLQSLRSELLESALGFYRTLADQRSNDPAVLADLAVTNLRVAVVYGASDRNDDSVAALQSGLELVDQLRREHPQAAEQHQKLAGFWRGRRNIQSNSKLPRDPLAAFQALQNLTVLWERFVEENPNVVGFQSDLAANYNTLAELLIASSHRADGLAYLRKANTAWGRLVRENPTVREYRADLSRTCEDLAWYLTDPDQAEEAQSARRQALTLREQLAADFPDMPQYRLDLAESLKSLGDYAARRGSHHEAVQAYGRSIELCQTLVEKFPNLALYSEHLVVSQHERLNVLTSTGQVSGQQAEQSRLEAIEAVTKLARNFPADSFFLSHLAQCNRELAVFLVADGRAHEAIAAYRQEIKHLAALPSSHPSQPYYRTVLAHANLNLGELLAANGERNEGGELCRAALAAFGKLVAEFPDNGGYVIDLVECQRRMAATSIDQTSPDTQ